MGGSTQQTTSSGTTEPWGPVQQPLKNIMGAAGNMYNAGVGEQVYPGTTVVPFSQPTQAAIIKGTNMASAGNPLTGVLNQHATDTIAAGGMAPGMEEAMTNLRGIASGDPGANPFFQQALDYQSGKIGDQVNSYFSSKGRVGSGAHGGTMAKELAGMRFSALADQFNRDIAHKMSAATTMGNISGMGASNAQAWGGMAPSIDALRFADIDRLSKIGGVIEGKQGEVMTENKEKFDQQNMLPWTHLSQYSDIISPPAVRFPSTSSTSKTKTPWNPLSLVGVPMMAMGK